LDDRLVVFSIINLLLRRLLGELAVIVRPELSKVVELLVLRHETYLAHFNAARLH
jgi:hypothetical protein